MKQLELRVSLGMGRPGAETLVFSTYDGKPLNACPCRTLAKGRAGALDVSFATSRPCQRAYRCRPRYRRYQPAAWS